MNDGQRNQYTMRSMQSDLESLKGGGPAEQSVAVPAPQPRTQQPSQAGAPPPNLPHVPDAPQRPAAPPPTPPTAVREAPKVPLPPRPSGPEIRNLAAEPSKPAGPPSLSSRPLPKMHSERPKDPVKPTASGSKRSMKVPLLLFAGFFIIILIGVEVWWFFIRPDSVDPIVKPPTDGLVRPEDTLPTDINEPPPPGEQQTAVADPLLGYSETDTITLQSADPAAVVAALNLAVAESRTSGRPTRLVFLVPQGNSQREVTWSELSTALQFSIPASVQSQLVGSYNLFVMPKTAFDDTTCSEAKAEAGCAGPRLGIALGASESASLQSSLKNWEATMVQDLRHLIVANISGETRPFIDASYRGASIRYRNLPLPTVTIDYALLEKKLIITTSKSLMFAALDSL